MRTPKKSKTQAAKEFTGALLDLVANFPPEGFNNQYFIICAISNRDEEATKYIREFITERTTKQELDKLNAVSFLVPMPSDIDLPASEMEYVRIPFGVEFLAWHNDSGWATVKVVSITPANGLLVEGKEDEGISYYKYPSIDLLHGAYNFLIGEGNIPPLGEPRDAFTQISRFVKPERSNV